MGEYRCSECGTATAIPNAFGTGTWNWCDGCDGMRRFHREVDDE